MENVEWMNEWTNQQTNSIEHQMVVVIFNSFTMETKIETKT